MTNFNSNNNSVNNNVKFYIYDGDQVFLANRDEMDELGIEPVSGWDVDDFGIAAYHASDYKDGIDTRMTFLEDYADGYSDDNDEIYLGQVVNPENESIINKAWILESDRRDVYDDLNEHQCYQGDEGLDAMLGISGYEDLLDAMYENGSDPELIEDHDEAFRVYNVLKDCQNTIAKTDETDEWWETSKRQLDLEDCEVRYIYQFNNGCEGHICLLKDYK